MFTKATAHLATIFLFISVSSISAAGNGNAQKPDEKVPPRVVAKPFPKNRTQVKLDSIIIPKFAVAKGLTIEEVINKLSKSARFNDPVPHPKDKGVSFVVRKRANANGAPRIIVEKKLDFKNETLGEILLKISKSANKELKVSAEEFVVAIEGGAEK